MQLNLYITFIITIIINGLIYGQFEYRQVLEKDLSYQYYGDAIELEDEKVILIADCVTEECNQLILDKIDLNGKYEESHFLDIPWGGTIEYLVSVKNNFNKNQINCLIKNYRNDSLFLLNVNVDIQKLELTLSESIFIDKGYENLKLTSPKKKGNSSIIGGFYSSSGNVFGASLFITIDENNAITDFRKISPTEMALLEIQDLELIGDDKFLIINTNSFLILDNNYEIIFGGGLQYYDEQAQASVFFIALGNDISKIDDYTFLVDGVGVIGDSPISRHIIVKVDISNDQVQYEMVSHAYHPTDSPVFPSEKSSLKTLSNKTFYICGYENRIPNYIYLEKLDYDLKPIWRKQLGGDYFHKLQNFTILSNGNLLLYGRVENYFNQSEKQGFYIILDENGLLLSSSENIIEADQLSIFPNPTSGNIQINVPNGNNEYSFTILNNLGQTILTKNSVSSDTELALDQFPEGLYYLHIVDQDGAIQIEKIIKQ